MILCLSAGNTNIFGCVFKEDEIILRFRHANTPNHTADQFGLFLRSIMRENGIDASKIKEISICSVVPTIDYSLRAACIKYFNIKPFMLHNGVKTYLKIRCQAEEIGADRLANAIAATFQYPEKNLIIVSMGTATTIDAIKKNKTYLSGAILPGFRIAMLALQDHTAKLPAVEIIKPKHAIGKNTIENIQSGLYFGQLGAIRELIRLFTAEAFHDEQPFIIGTGGFSSIFMGDKIFDSIEPDLILHGMRIAIKNFTPKKSLKMRVQV